MKNDQQNDISDFDKAKALETQYLQYFLPPEQYNEKQFFEQFDIYDKTTPVYTTDSTVEVTHA